MAVPLFVIGFFISQGDFAVIWRYFGWANQTLATIVLWAGAAYLLRQGKLHWIATVPATFMTAVVATYLAYDKIGFGLPLPVATAIGSGAAFLALACSWSSFAAEGYGGDRLGGGPRLSRPALTIPAPRTIRASWRPASSGGALFSWRQGVEDDGLRIGGRILPRRGRAHG